MGFIESEPVLDGGAYWCRVRFRNRVDEVVEDDLDPLDESDLSIEGLMLAGRWGPLRAFRSALAVERISHSSQNTVYSFRSQRVLFEPYQYKPLLKLLESTDRRLLIADEVGLGKTIETGLILTELNARKNLDKVLIVCPSRLRDKWREEMNRKFDQDFGVFDRKGLTQYIERIRESPSRGRLRAIVSMQTMRNKDLREELGAEVSQFDLVVVDEAHHARNPETQTSEMLRDLGGLSDAVLLLTATPLHLGSRDLHTLLHALRPTEFRDPTVFERELESHRGILEAALFVRQRDPAVIPDIVSRIRQSSLRKAGASSDPRAQTILDELEASTPSDVRGWIDLERRVQDLHPLASILTRTRKRDVKERAPLRRAQVVKCQWTQSEDDAYQRLVGIRSPAGWVRERLSLGQVQRARQAASCLTAAIEASAARAATNDDDAVEFTDILPDEIRRLVAPGQREPVAAEVPDLPPPDSKFEKLCELLRTIDQDDPGCKVLIFTFFKGTARYLERQLTDRGWMATRIDGDVPSNPFQPALDERGRRIRQFRDNPAIRVMVSTEVGSEGLDFQFCNRLVNYDLPWNPMVVEQRIGRVDRFGQTKDVVHIHSIVVEGTVEDRILYQLYERIKIFESSIGDLEAILGDTVASLQRDYIAGKLTPEESERRVELAARAIEANRSNLEVLEERAAELFGHEEYIRDEMRRVGRLGRYLSEGSLLSVVETYLHTRHPGLGLWQERPGVHAIRITEKLRHDIEDASQTILTWRRMQDNILKFTTDGEVAFRDPDVELVNVSHPLIRAAVAGIRDQLADPVARVGHATVRLSESEAGLSPGRYYVVVWTHNIDGLRSRAVLESLAWAEAADEILDADLAERLLHIVTEEGEEWAGAEPPPPLASNCWIRLSSEARRRNREIESRESRENEALFVRRNRVMEAEFALQREGIEKRLETAKAHERPERILRLFESQLERLEARRREFLKTLEGQRRASVRLSSPLAACVIEVRSREQSFEEKPS